MSQTAETVERQGDDLAPTGTAGAAACQVDRVLLAAPRGFCAGVEMAIKALAWMVRIFEPPVYCYHEIIHNRPVVERFKSAGVIFVDNLGEVPDGAPLMLSALVRSAVARLAPKHGVETVTVTEEDEYFPPPRELRELLRNTELPPEAQAMLANDRALSASDVLGMLAPPSTAAAARAVLRGGRPGSRDPKLRLALSAENTRHVGQVLGRYVAQVEAEITSMLEESVDDTWLRGAIGYHFGWADTEFRPLPAETTPSGGKKLRPALAVLAYHGALFGSGRHLGDANHLDLDRILPFAAALELLHNYSLVHDDIQDGDRQRRGRATLWTVCGLAQAINVGNCLHALSLGCLDRLVGRGVDPARVTELIATMARASVELTIGQKRDIAFESDSNIDTESYLQMIAGKTAALTRCATFGGALLALGQTEPSANPRLNAFGDFGHHLGLAFQIRDDVLGVWGSSDETGKPVGGDIRRKKMSLPVIFAFHASDEKMSRHCQQIYSRPEELDDSDEAEVRAMLEATGAHGYTQREAQRQAALAKQALTAAAGGTAALDANPFLVDLASLANFAIDRRS